MTHIMYVMSSPSFTIPQMFYLHSCLQSDTFQQGLNKTNIQEQAYLMEVEWRLFGSSVKKKMDDFFRQNGLGRSLDPAWLKNDAQMMKFERLTTTPIFLGSERLADVFFFEISRSNHRKVLEFQGEDSSLFKRRYTPGN